MRELQWGVTSESLMLYNSIHQQIKYSTCFREIIGKKQCDKSINAFTKSQLTAHQVIVIGVKLCKCFMCMNAFKRKKPNIII